MRSFNRRHRVSKGAFTQSADGLRRRGHELSTSPDEASALPDGNAARDSVRSAAAPGESGVNRTDLGTTAFAVVMRVVRTSLAVPSDGVQAL